MNIPIVTVLSIIGWGFGWVVFMGIFHNTALGLLWGGITAGILLKCIKPSYNWKQVTLFSCSMIVGIYVGILIFVPLWPISQTDFGRSTGIITDIILKGISGGLGGLLMAMCISFLTKKYEWRKVRFVIASWICSWAVAPSIAFGYHTWFSLILIGGITGFYSLTYLLEINLKNINFYTIKLPKAVFIILSSVAMLLFSMEIFQARFFYIFWPLGAGISGLLIGYSFKTVYNGITWKKIYILSLLWAIGRTTLLGIIISGLSFYIILKSEPPNLSRGQAVFLSLFWVMSIGVIVFICYFIIFNLINDWVHYFICAQAGVIHGVFNVIIFNWQLQKSNTSSALIVP